MKKSRKFIAAIGIILGGWMAFVATRPMLAQGGGADFTRFVGVGDSLTAGVVARGCVGLVAPQNVSVGVRILLVGAKMDVAELGTSQNLMPFADSGAVVLRGNQTVCVQGDPVTIIGGPQVQAGTIVQGRGMPTSAQLVASQLTIDKVTGRTLSTTTQRIE